MPKLSRGNYLVDIRKPMMAGILFADVDLTFCQVGFAIGWVSEKAILFKKRYGKLFSKKGLILACKAAIIGCRMKLYR